MELVAYNLNRHVDQWYKILLKVRNASRLPSLTWKEFTEVLMMKILPVNKREKFAVEFERMKQTPRISIEEYEEQFTRLSKYACPHLVSTETMKVRRFA